MITRPPTEAAITRPSRATSATRPRTMFLSARTFGPRSYKIWRTNSMFPFVSVLLKKLATTWLICIDQNSNSTPAWDATVLTDSQWCLDQCYLRVTFWGIIIESSYLCTYQMLLFFQKKNTKKSSERIFGSGTHLRGQFDRLLKGSLYILSHRNLECIWP